MADGDDNTGRDQRGRFGPGPRGPRRATLLRQAVEEAVTSDQMATLTRKILLLALQGNLPAARLLYERTCGRAAEAPVDAEPVEVAIPRMRTVADCDLATERIIDGILKGTISPQTAQTLLDAVAVRIKVIDATQFEQRLANLEQTASNAQRNAAYAPPPPDPRFP